MAIGLNDLKSKNEPKRHVFKLEQQQHLEKFPWSNIDQEESKTTEDSFSTEETLEEELITRTRVAQEAVKRAREIVVRNEAQIREIHQRRIGKDLGPLPDKLLWTEADDNLFYLKQNPIEHGGGIFSKLRKWFQSSETWQGE